MALSAQRKKSGKCFNVLDRIRFALSSVSSAIIHMKMFVCVATVRTYCVVRRLTLEEKAHCGSTETGALEISSVVFWPGKGC